MFIRFLYTFRIFFYHFVLIFVVTVNCNISAEQKTNVRQLLKQIVPKTSQTDYRIDREKIHRADYLKKFYAAREHVPIWVVGQYVPISTHNFLVCIFESADHGLFPEDYHLEAINNLLSMSKATSGILEPIDLVKLEVLLTDAYLLLGSHYLGGKVEPESLNENWKTNRRDFDLVYYLGEAIKDNDLCYSLELLAPIDPDYENLKDALRTYRSLRWDSIVAPQNIALQKGNQDSLILEVRKRLQVTGELASGPLSSEYDDELELAVREFQRKHGLHYDGIVRINTIDMMNVPAIMRIQQIRANLERWRWQPDIREPRYVLINVADYNLKMIVDEQIDYQAKVIVGRDNFPTPLFSDEITYLVLNPNWNLPKSIARNELMLEVKADSFYLENNDIRVFKGKKKIDPSTVNWQEANPDEYHFQQGSNAFNPMGAVKFMFPNAYSIYLHDTPEKHLFTNSVRSNSHGCIRLENPINFAEYVLARNAKGHWSRPAIDSILFNQKQKRINLTQGIPIHILYWTVFTDNKEQLHFRRDVYSWDLLIDNALHFPL